MPVTELERLMVRLVGDNTNYVTAMKEAQKQTEISSKVIQNEMAQMKKSVDEFFEGTKAQSKKATVEVVTFGQAATASIYLFAEGLKEVMTLKWWHDPVEGSKKVEYHIGKAHEKVKDFHFTLMGIGGGMIAGGPGGAVAGGLLGGIADIYGEVKSALEEAAKTDRMEKMHAVIKEITKDTGIMMDAVRKDVDTAGMNDMDKRVYNFRRKAEEQIPVQGKEVVEEMIQQYEVQEKLAQNTNYLANSKKELAISEAGAHKIGLEREEAMKRQQLAQQGLADSTIDQIIANDKLIKSMDEWSQVQSMVKVSNAGTGKEGWEREKAMRAEQLAQEGLTKAQIEARIQAEHVSRINEEIARRNTQDTITTSGRGLTGDARRDAMEKARLLQEGYTEAQAEGIVKQDQYLRGLERQVAIEEELHPPLEVRIETLRKSTKALDEEALSLQIGARAAKERMMLEQGYSEQEAASIRSKQAAIDFFKRSLQEQTAAYGMTWQEAERYRMTLEDLTESERKAWETFISFKSELKSGGMMRELERSVNGAGLDAQQQALKQYADELREVVGLSQQERDARLDTYKALLNQKAALNAAGQLVQNILGPEKNFKQQIEGLKRMLGDAMIDPATYRRAVRMAQEEFARAKVRLDADVVMRIERVEAMTADNPLDAMLAGMNQELMVNEQRAIAKATQEAQKEADKNIAEQPNKPENANPDEHGNQLPKAINDLIEFLKRREEQGIVQFQNAGII